MAFLEIDDALAQRLMNLAESQHCSMETLLQSILITPPQPAQVDISLPPILALQLLLENYSSGFVLAFDENLRCLIAGGKPRSIQGMPLSIHRGMHLAEVLPEPLYQPLEQAFKAIFDGQENVINTRYEGHTYQAAIQPLQSDGILYAGLMTLRERRQESPSYEEKQRTLENERSRILLKFIQDVSHEFKTPITAIKIDLYLMERTKNEEQRHARILDIEKQADLIIQLVDDLQTMAKLDNEQGSTSFSAPLDINDTVRTAYRIAQRKKSPDEAAVISLRMDVNLPKILGDHEAMTRAIAEIIHNAIRFTPANGSIVVQTYHAENANHIIIQDTGVGMTQDTLQKAFERFHRADEAHTTPGFGLGLPMAQKIVQKHGGTISIDSHMGEGTTVTISLPIHPALIEAIQLR
ncbi:ATP-binding protein [Phototrophicus methaneseepsis]|uniref:histidine kinase n=1 Tax=Phototrophicus methaneseepsis TaxID=2710758 RepID=A0A7S8IEZ1_9CHLR|nr:PAS domain-containing sensor histidine kinase [Phototrophicus methaneseepsis]QPC82964.1 ATP-binding protein [Phototrophicus methaneseepsis]